MLICKPAPRTAQATLDFVGNQHRARLLRKLARTREEVGTERANAALALHRFQQNGADAFVEFVLEIREVVVLHETHAGHQRTKWLAIFFGCGGCQRAECSAVK